MPLIQTASSARAKTLKRSVTIAESDAPSHWTKLKCLLQGDDSVSFKELVLFTRQFATLIGAGVPIVQGLHILTRQAKGAYFKQVLQSIREDIEAGLSISTAIGKHPKVFPDLYVAMIKAGELGGILDAVLERLCAYLESAQALRTKVKGALTYPAVVLSICAAVTVFLLVFVIPTFQRIFEGLGAKLPWITQLLVDLSTVMKRYFPLILASPVAAWKVFSKFYATPKGRERVDRAVLYLPLTGPLALKAAVAKFSRTLSTLLKAGVPALQALETVAATSGNVIVAEAILTVKASISEGGRFAEPLALCGIFPEMVVSMIAVGEETGCLDIMLAKIADFYDQEVDAEVHGLTSMIEPLVIVIMGIVVGTIVTAMFLPMFNAPGII